MRSTVFGVCSILLVLIQQNSLHALEIVTSDNDTNGIGKEKKDPNPSPESPQNSSENAAATLDKWANVEPIDTPALSFKTNLIEPFSPLANLMFEPMFHFKRIFNTNRNVGDMENNGPRCMKYEVPNMLDVKENPGVPYHKSVLITKLNDPSVNSKTIPRFPNDNKNTDPMLRPKQHPFFSPDPFFPHFDVLDSIMDSLMQPLNDPYPPPKVDTKAKLPESRDTEDSSLKFWIRNENAFKNKPRTIKLNKRKIDTMVDPLVSENKSAVAVDNELSEDYPDYKTDLWKKYGEKGDKKTELKFKNSDDFKGVKDNTWLPINDSDNERAPDTINSNEENKINKYLKENENEWWNRLVFPRKPKIIRDHKKGDCGRQEKLLGDSDYDDESSLNEDDSNFRQIHLVFNRTKPKSKRVKASADDLFIDLVIIGFLMTIMLLLYKISKLLYQEYNASVRTQGGLPVRRPWKIGIPTPGSVWCNPTPPSPPPCYSIHVPVPTHTTSVK